VLVQERKLAHASFPPKWNDLIRDVYACLRDMIAFPHGRMMFEMCLCLCKRES
jgi:hypothetical protein